MNLQGLTLAEVAAEVNAVLCGEGMRVVVVGGSAITIHAPEVYTSYDIDLAFVSGIERRAITQALAKIGFLPQGRDFVNATTPYTVDIVADTPYVDQRPLHEFVDVQTTHGSVTVVQLRDAIADRVAAFLYWDDSQSLEVAERALRANRTVVVWDDVSWALEQLDHSGPAFEKKFVLARDRLRNVYRES